VLVEVKWQRPLGGTRQGGTVTVSVLGVGGLEKFLGLFDWNDDGNPVVGWRVANLVNTVLDEPLVDQVLAVGGWTNNVCDLVGAEVLAVTLVFWVGDLEQMTLDGALVALLQSDLKVDGLRLVGGSHSGPDARHWVALLDCI